MNRLALLLACLALATSAGCGDDDESRVSDVEFVTLDEGFVSNYSISGGKPLQEPTLFQLSDAESFSEFWALHRRTLPPPEIDFDAETILALIDVSKGTLGDSIRVSRVERMGRALLVEALRREFGPTCLRPALYSQPFHIVRIAKTHRTATLSLKEDLIKCEPILPR